MPSVPHRWLAALLLAALVAAAYHRGLENDFVFDDRMFIRDDPRVKSVAESPRLFVEALWGYADERDGVARIHQYYRPLQTFPLALINAAFGPNPWPAHLLSLILHWLNCLLVLTLFTRILGPPALAPLLAALVFAVHPGYSEAILWISDLAGLGAAACTLAIVVLYLSRHATRWYGLLATAVLSLLGLWFKESGALPPALLLLYDVLLAPDRGVGRPLRRWRCYAVFVPPLALYLWLRTVALGGLLPGLHVVTLNRWEMVLNAVALLPEFLRTFLWPFDLNMYHDFDAVRGVLNAPFALGAAVLLGGAVGFAATARARPVVAFGLAWALITALPYLLIRWPKLNVYAERYTYLPAVGLLFVLAYTGRRRAARAPRPVARLATAGVAALLVVCIVVDHRRAPDWRSDETIYAKTVTQSARAELVRSNLAIRYLELGRYDEGIALMQQVIAVDPDWNDAWYNLASIYLAKGEHDRALAAFREAKTRDPYKGATLLNLGYLHDLRGERDAALDAYLRLVDVDPDHIDGWFNLALIAAELGQARNARAAIAEVLQRTPDKPDAQALARRIAALPEAPPRPPGVERPKTLRRCAEAKRAIDENRAEDAIALLRVAAWYDERSALPHQYLANAYYLAGRLKKAAQAQREALARDPENQLYRTNLASLEAMIAQ